MKQQILEEKVVRRQALHLWGFILSDTEGQIARR